MATMESSWTVFSSLAVLLVSLVSLSLLTLVYRHLNVLYRLWSLSLPGFKGYPFTGLLIPLMFKNQQKGLQPNVRPLMAALGMCTAVFKNEGIIQLKTGLLKPVVVLCKPETAEVLLSDTREVKKTKEYDYISDWLGAGLITSWPDVWRRHRKLLTPTFHFRILDGFQPIMSEHGTILVDILKKSVGKEFEHIELPVTMCTLDVISDTALGIKLGAQQDGNSDYVQSVFKATALITHRMLSPWLWPAPMFWLSPTGRELVGHLKTLNGFIKGVIAQRKSELEKEFSNLSPQELEETIPKKRRAFLDMLLLHNMSNLDNKLTEQEILDEVHTFTFTAHDTVAMATYWVMYYLGLYPDIQKKVHEEIDAVFDGDTRRPISLDDVKNMGYLERVIKESQRLTPAVPAVLRNLLQDLNINGVVLPKGTTVGVFMMCIHRDPETYPNPDVFDPDRFLDQKRHPFAFIPFSAGPRSCLGQKYASLCMRTIMANLVRNLSWTSLDPLDKVLFNAEFAIRPSIPLRLKFRDRNLPQSIAARSG